MKRMFEKHSGWSGWSRGIAALSVCALTSGCIFTVADSDADDSGDDASMPDPNAPDTERQLDGCADGMSDAEIADTVQITYDFNDSAHEMIVCGGLVFAIVGALIEGLVDLAQDPQRTTLPEQYSYDGAGTYYVDVDGFNDLEMEVQFYLTQDYEFGVAGDLVKENLFDMNSYLVNPRTTVETELTSSGLLVTITIEHDGPGPLVELLGMGPNPESPIHVSQSDLNAAGSALGKLEVDATIRLTDHPSVASITYDVDSPRMLASSIFNGTPMELDLIDGSGARTDLNQTLSVHTWTVDYVDGAVGALDGEIGFTVRGDGFDFDANLAYPAAPVPKITITCAE
jgi:hypothetical protein